MSSKARKVMGLLGLCMLLAAQPAAAHGPGQRDATRLTQVLPEVPRARSGPPLQFDWLAKRATPQRSGTAPTAHPQRAGGRSAYICSAAGFGMQSRCTER